MDTVYLRRHAHIMIQSDRKRSRRKTEPANSTAPHGQAEKSPAALETFYSGSHTCYQNSNDTKRKGGNGGLSLRVSASISPSCICCSLSEDGDYSVAQGRVLSLSLSPAVSVSLPPSSLSLSLRFSPSPRLPPSLSFSLSLCVSLPPFLSLSLTNVSPRYRHCGPSPKERKKKNGSKNAHKRRKKTCVKSRDRYV